MACILFIMATLVEFGVYNLIALPAGQTSTIGIVEKDSDGDGQIDTVSYLDTFIFLGEDLKQSITREPRFFVRSWFKWDWWQNGMRWADVAVEAVVGVVVPVIAPVYEIKEIQYYYTNNNPIVGTIGDGEYIVNGLYVLNATEINKITPSNPEYDPLFVETFEDMHGTSFAYAEFSNPVIIDGISSSVVTGGSIYKISNGKVEELTYWVRYGTSRNFTSNEWKKENTTFTNTLMKINKYNSADANGNNVYTKWMYKFIDIETRVIKSSACSLYFQFYLALILAIWFSYQNPIVIKRNEYGEDEVTGGFRHRETKKERRRHEFHLNRHKHKNERGD